MKKAKTDKEVSKRRKPRPALDPDARENQMIALAVDLAEEQLLDGTASSQVITHYLKLASSRHRLENEKLKSENELLKAKCQSLQSAARVEDLYNEAIKAFTVYKGGDDNEPEENLDIF